MVTKSVVSVLLLTFLACTFATSCEKPVVEAGSFTSLDATVVTQIAFITEFTLKCNNELPENYPLHAEVDGKILPAVKIGENKYQVSWTDEINKARSGSYEVKIMDEESFASLRRARRNDPAATVPPLVSIVLHHPGSFNGPWVNSEVLATVLSLLIAYTALRNKSAILA